MIKSEYFEKKQYEQLVEINDISLHADRIEHPLQYYNVSGAGYLTSEVKYEETVRTDLRRDLY